MVPSYGLLQVQEDRIPSFRGVGKNVDSRSDYSGFQDGLVDWLWDLLGIADGLRTDCGRKESAGAVRPRGKKVLLRMPDSSTTTSERALKPPKSLENRYLKTAACGDESVLGAKEHQSLLVSLRRWSWVLDRVDWIDWIDWIDSGRC